MMILASDPRPRPARPLRLLAVLAASVAFFAIAAAALYALLWVIDDLRDGGRTGQVAGIEYTPKQSDFKLPDGVLAVQRVPDEATFEQLAGFAPFVPADVPSTTSSQAVLAVTFPDDAGNRIGRVGFAARDDAAVDGVIGPLVVLMESPPGFGKDADGVLRRLTSGAGRALVATLPCRGLVVELQMYFQPDPRPGEEPVTPYMTSVGQRYLDNIKSACTAP